MSKFFNFWTPEEDQLLLSLIDNNQRKRIKWLEIAEGIPGKTGTMCKARKAYLIQKTNAWDTNQDLQLLQAIQQHGQNWNIIYEEFGRTKTIKQIQKRFFSSLDPKINRVQFTEKDDQKIHSLMQQYGKNWQKIAENFTNKPQLMIKNRYYSHIKKRQNITQKKLYPIGEITSQSQELLNSFENPQHEEQIHFTSLDQLRNFSSSEDQQMIESTNDFTKLPINFNGDNSFILEYSKPLDNDNLNFGLNIESQQMYNEQFTAEDDQKISYLIKKYGKNWQKISQNFICKSPQMIKNRYYSCLNKLSQNSYKIDQFNSQSYKPTHLLEQIPQSDEEIKFDPLSIFNQENLQSMNQFNKISTNFTEKNKFMIKYSNLTKKQNDDFKINLKTEK